MQNIYYSTIGIVAIMIHLIINYDVLKVSKGTKAQIAYRNFMFGLLTYHTIDATWGILAYFQFSSALYIDTILYCSAVTISILLWCQYVITYLNLRKLFGKFLKISGFLFCFFAIIFLAVNHFNHSFFWIDTQGGYHTNIIRYISLGSQITLFLLTTVQSFTAAMNTAGSRRGRHIAIALFGVVMIAAVISQSFIPLFPFYAIGFLVGTCILHIYVQQDEKDEIQKKLAANNQAIASAGYGIWKFTFDEEGKLNGLLGNDKWHEIFGVHNSPMTPQERLKFYNDRLTPKSFKDVKDDYEQMRNGIVKRRTFEWNHPTKGLVYLSVGGTRQEESDGTVAISGFVGDVTSEIVAQEYMNHSLEQARKQAEEANMAKTKFLFNMSHDIRTPMNAIIGFTELLQKNLDNPEKRANFVKKIQDSSQFLLSLINNVLEMARIESGKASLDISINNTDIFIQEFRSVFEEQMKQKNIDFSITVDVQHHNIYCDALKIREIFLNLLSNAYKYTMPGGKVSVEIKEFPSEKEGYCIYQGTISDTGIGISKEFLPKLFDEFSREHSFTDNKIEGTGLGMPIVKKYTELMGATISVESEINKGTTFVFRSSHKIADSLPEKHISETTSEKTSFMGKKILLAEDNDLNAEIAIEILTNAGFTVVRAEDGLQCIQILEQEHKNPFDLILMDIQMPNLDGYKTAEAIRQMQDPDKSKIPILAMTANAFEEDKKAAFDAGMNGHLAKPINVPSLMRELSQILETTTKEA